MDRLTKEKFELLIGDLPYRGRFTRDLEFRESTAHLDEAAWNDLEVLPIWSANKQSGLLLLQPEERIHAVPFLFRKPATAGSGQLAPVVCNFCCTWRGNGGGGQMTFYPANLPEESAAGTQVCYDLKCSDHAREKTQAALMSKLQMFETLDAEGRVKRLKNRLAKFIAGSELPTLEIRQ